MSTVTINLRKIKHGSCFLCSSAVYRHQSLSAHLTWLLPSLLQHTAGPQRCNIIRKVPKTCNSEQLELFQFPVIGAGAKSGSKQPPRSCSHLGTQRGSIMWCLLVTAGIS